ncbi:MAG: nitrilase-related carbon-nitrogen hydrolase [Rhodospirillaceae bacterium]|nr:nitrilase-related carbon-nitrogen hydrolase [Rhodospirillaceae bacterium]
MALLWKATCMQTDNNIVNDATTRAEAMAIINRSLDRWEQLLKTTVMRGGPLKQLCLFPEFNLQGFPLHENSEQWIDKACLDIPGSKEIERLQKMAQGLGIYLGANAYERDKDWPGRYFNTSFLIGPSGDLLLKYRRISTAEAGSPHDFWDKYLDRYGIEGVFPVAKTEIGNIAMMPCGEILWPETARCLMMRGAEVILHPTSDHGASDHMAWESAKRVRAAENMVYFVSANSGRINGSALPNGVHVGNSKIIDFQGQVMTATGGAGESTTSAVIDMDALRRARTTPAGVYGVNRVARIRAEVYAEVYKSARFYPVNKFLDKPMDSKKRVTENLAEAIEALVARGILNWPSDHVPQRKAAE